MTALSQLASHYPGPYGPGGGFHPWFLLFPFGFVLFWVLVLVLLRIFVFRRWGGPGRGWGPGGPGGSRQASAEQTLATRFAAGDIDEQEYRARLEVLRSSPPDPGVA